MNRFRTRLIMGAAVVIAAAAVGFGIAPAQAAGGLSATFSKDSDWGSGYQGKYTIKNGSTSTITSWKVEFDLLSGTMGTFWDALVTTSGSHQTAVNRDYNGTVAPGASVSFGFIVNGGGTSPANCRLNGASCDAGGGGGGDTTPPSVPGSLRVTGTSSSSAGLSNQVSATTGGCGGGTVALPVAPYVDMGAFPTPDMPSMATSGNLKGFTMAFIISVGCGASWFNAFDPRTRDRK